MPGSRVTWRGKAQRIFSKQMRCSWKLDSQATSMGHLPFTKLLGCLTSAVYNVSCVTIGVYNCSNSIKPACSSFLQQSTRPDLNDLGHAASRIGQDQWCWACVADASIHLNGMYRMQGLRLPAGPSKEVFCTCKAPRRAGARAQRLPIAHNRAAAAATETPALPNTDTSPFWNSIAPGPLKSADFSKFVQFFRQASSYIEGHRGRTFVIVVPGEVIITCCITQWQLLQLLGTVLLQPAATQQAA